MAGAAMTRMGATSVAALKNIAKAAGVAAVAFGAWGISVAAQRQSVELGLKSMLGSAEAASRAMKRLQAVALKPGVTFDSGAQLATSLIAVRIEADVAIDAIEQFGNALALAGRGEAELQRVGVALSQIVSKGKVSAEEINQLAEAVPQIRAVMTDVFGTADTEKLQKEFAAAGVSAEQFIGLIVKGFGALPRAADSFANSITNLKAAFRDVAAAFGAAFATDEGAQGLRDITAAVTGLVPVFAKLGQTVAAWLPGIADWIKRTFTVENIEAWGATIKRVFAMFGTAIGRAKSTFQLWRDQFTITMYALPDLARAGFAELRVVALQELDRLVDDALTRLQPLIDLLDRLQGVGGKRGGRAVPLANPTSVGGAVGKIAGGAAGGVKRTAGSVWDYLRGNVGDAAKAFNEADKAASGAAEAVDDAGRSSRGTADATRSAAGQTSQWAQALDRLNANLRDAEDNHRNRVAVLEAEQRQVQAATAGTKAHKDAIDAEAAAVKQATTARQDYLKLLEKQKAIMAGLIAASRAQAYAEAQAGMALDDRLTAAGRRTGTAQGRAAAGSAMAAARRRAGQLPPAGSPEAGAARLRQLFLDELGKALPNVKALQESIRVNEARADALEREADANPKIADQIKTMADRHREAARQEQLRLEGLTAGFDQYASAVETGMQRQMDLTAQWLDFTARRLDGLTQAFGKSTDAMLTEIIGLAGERGELRRSIAEMIAGGAASGAVAGSREALGQIEDRLAQLGVGMSDSGVMTLPAPFGGAVSRLHGEAAARDPRSISVQMQGGQQDPRHASYTDSLVGTALGNFGIGDEAILAQARLNQQGRIIADATSSAMMPFTRVVVQAIREGIGRATRSAQDQLGAVEGAV